ncbi:hypothetical protein D9758_018459 [Tetrapyrgos nigripes]|uniref:CCHC-type domain-containing protein n=1 Tax=Tetrapyrgos nigripes TaxID=182062 RepID=A0A8H5BZM5_9AGAR|nr:hypothetical protein D9758_018459 [Tetrapyrgos nigripes]
MISPIVLVPTVQFIRVSFEFFSLDPLLQLLSDCLMCQESSLQQKNSSFKWTSHLWEPFPSEPQTPARVTQIALILLLAIPSPSSTSSPLSFDPPALPSGSLDAHLAHLEQASQSQNKQLAEILAALNCQNPPDPQPSQPPSHYPTHPPSSTSSFTTSSHHSSGASHAKMSPPGIFDMHFEDDITKIMWALSYFQTGCAATYHQSLIDHGHLLLGYLGMTSVDKYVDNLHALITMAGLNVKPVLYSMTSNDPTIKAQLEDTKHPALEKVAEAEACPQEWDVMAWYALAKRFDKHEQEDAIFCGAQRSMPPDPPRPSFPSHAQPQGCSLFPIQFPVPAPAPAPISCAPAPAQAPLPQDIPMEVDASRQRFLACRTCHTCGKTGHFSATCPDCQCEHVHFMDMSIDDWQEITEAYAAFQDFQATPVNEPAQEDFGKDQE